MTDTAGTRHTASDTPSSRRSPRRRNAMDDYASPIMSLKDEMESDLHENCPNILVSSPGQTNCRETLSDENYPQLDSSHAKKILETVRKSRVKDKLSAPSPDMDETCPPSSEDCTFGQDIRIFQTSFSVDTDDMKSYNQNFPSDVKTTSSNDNDETVVKLWNSRARRSIRKRDPFVSKLRVPAEFYDPTLYGDADFLDGYDPASCMNDPDSPLTISQFKASEYGKQLYTESQSLRAVWDYLDYDEQSIVAEAGTEVSLKSEQSDAATFFEQPVHVTTEQARHHLAYLATERLATSLNLAIAARNQFEEAIAEVRALCEELAMSDELIVEKSRTMIGLEREASFVQNEYLDYRAQHYNGDGGNYESQMSLLMDLYNSSIVCWQSMSQSISVSALAKDLLSDSRALDKFVYDMPLEDIVHWHSFDDLPSVPADPVNESDVSMDTKLWVKTIRRRSTKMYETDEHKVWNAARLPLTLAQLSPPKSILKPSQLSVRRHDPEVATLKSILKNSRESSPVRKSSGSSYVKSKPTLSQGIWDLIDPNYGEEHRTGTYKRLIAISDGNPMPETPSGYKRLLPKGDTSDDPFCVLKSGEEFRTSSFASGETQIKTGSLDSVSLKVEAHTSADSLNSITSTTQTLVNDSSTDHIKPHKSNESLKYHDLVVSMKDLKQDGSIRLGKASAVTFTSDSSAHSVKLPPKSPFSPMASLRLHKARILTPIKRTFNSLSLRRRVK